MLVAGIDAEAARQARRSLPHTHPGCKRGTASGGIIMKDLYGIAPVSLVPLPALTVDRANERVSFPPSPDVRRMVRYLNSKPF